MVFTTKRIRFYLGALLLLQGFSCVSLWPIVRTGYIDFRTFYTAGYMTRSGHSAELYNYSSELHFQNQLIGSSDRALPMMCAPYTALPFVPLSFLSFHNAYFVFLGINLMLLVASAMIVSPYLPALRGRWRTGPLALWLSSFPACVALMMGQLSAMLLLIYCLAFVLWKKDKPLTAGLVLSLGLMKFQVALPVVVLFLAWRQWRFVSGFLGGALSLTAISTAILGAKNLIPYLHSLVSMTSAVSPDVASQLHFGIFPSLMPNLYGLFFSLTGGTTAGSALVFATSAALLVWAMTRKPSFPLALLVGMLVSYHLFLYDLTLLLLPLSLAANRFIQDEETFTKSTGMMAISSLAKPAAALLIFTPAVLILLPKSASYLLAIPIVILALSAKSLFGPPDTAAVQGSESHLADLVPSPL